MKSLFSILCSIVVVFLVACENGQKKESAPPAGQTQNTPPAAQPPHRPTFEQMDPAVAAQKESKFLTNVTQVTSVGQTGEGYFAPDGSAIIYQSIRGDHPFYQIYTRACATPFMPDVNAPETLVSTGQGRTTCAYFHPKADRIIYASSHLDPRLEENLKAELEYLAELKRDPSKRRGYVWDFDPYMDIFEADLDGGNLKRLTDAHGYDAEGAYSPDGKLIAYCSFRTGNGDIYIMNSDGTSPRRLTDSPGYDGGPFVSPDGKRIIFRGEATDPQTGELIPEILQLFVMDIDGRNKRQLTNNPFVNFGPYWHPDSRHIIYATSAHGHHNYELYLMDIKTGKEQRVTYTAGADVLPVFSPDGSKLMWTSKRGTDTSQLFVADWVYTTE